MSQTDRINKLETEVADLRAQLAELTKPAPAPPTEPSKPRAVVEEGPRVYTVPASNSALCDAQCR